MQAELDFSGMDQAASSAGEAFQEAAYQWALAYLRYHPELHSGDPERHGCPVPPNGEWRSWGAVVARLKREGLLEVAYFEPRPSGNGAPAKVYASRLFEATA